MSAPLWRWSLVDLAAGIARREVSPVEAVESVLGRIAVRGRLNAYITVLGEKALDEARERERQLVAGRPLGPLHGVPIALKDNIATAGTTTTAGSPLRARWVPHEDAAVVRALRAAGAVIVGKNNLYELAFGAAHPQFGETPNPWDAALTCGGSSNGSGVAVADGQAHGAIGTDTGGSIRIPAAMCGIVGLKPTRGLISNRGVVPVSPELDVVGPMARSVADAALMLRGLAGSAGEALQGAVAVGIPQSLQGTWLAPAVAEALETARLRLQAAGFGLREIMLPDLSLALDVMWAIASADAAACHHDGLRERGHELCDAVRDNLLAGALIPAVDYIRAQRLRQRIGEAMAAVMREVDAVLLPTVPITPFHSGLRRVVADGVEVDSLPLIMRFTPLANLTGQPAVVVPVTPPRDGPPVTVQLYGRPGEEATLLRVAAAVERETVAWPDQAER